MRGYFEDKVLEGMEPGKTYSTFDLCNATGFTFTDIVFVIGRMREAGTIREVGFHEWSCVPAESGAS